MANIKDFLSALFIAVFITILPITFAVFLLSFIFKILSFDSSYFRAASITIGSLIYLYTVYSLGTGEAHRIPDLESALSDARAKNDQLTKQFADKECTLAERETTLEQDRKELNELKGIFQKERDEILKSQSDLNHLLHGQEQSAPWLAAQIADYEHLQDLKRANALIRKSRPALKGAEEVRAISAEKRELLARCKMLEYQLNYFETLFPWLEEFKQLPPKVGAEYAFSSDDEYDHVKNWLSPEEYQRLPSAQRNQLALDRWSRRKKSDWEAGIEYERYVGYRYEQAGYRVQYSGAQYGLEDMGRDLIAENHSNILVVQCKRWAQEKTIHEKHIFQLYGSTVLFSLNSLKTVKGVFITTTKLSDLARECANYLNIKCRENFPLSDYPMIKCNVSRDGSKIYHLPFDQQYDKVVIEPEKGEFYAWTVQEAEDAGFRRAYRWHSNS